MWRDQFYRLLEEKVDYNQGIPLRMTHHLEDVEDGSVGASPPTRPSSPDVVIRWDSGSMYGPPITRVSSEEMLAIREAVPSPFPTPQNSQTEVSPSVAHISTAHLGEIPNEMESEAPVERTDALADAVSYERLCAQNYH